MEQALPGYQGDYQEPPKPGKLVRGIVLAPMWPLIWLQMGFGLKPCRAAADDGCGLCAGGSLFPGCCERAEAMVRWWRG
jgi:hypothetical protein